MALCGRELTWVERLSARSACIGASAPPGPERGRGRHHFMAGGVRSSAATRVTTDDQSCSLDCLKSRIAGYHGVESRSSIQRQSGANGRSSQQRRPRAPARCATLVSTLMTRSSSATNPAVSTSDALSGKGTIRSASAIPSRSLLASPCCNEYQAISGRTRSGANAASGHERFRSLLCFLLPAQTRPTLRLPLMASIRARAAARCGSETVM